MSERVARRTFLGLSAGLFAASLAVSVVWRRAMAAASEPPCGWTAMIGWAPMPGQSVHAVAASFLGMWTVMMVAMMMPSLLPVLWRYRLRIGRAGTGQAGVLAALVGLGYFLAWSMLGLVALPLTLALGALATRLPMPGRDIPVVLGTVVAAAGALQFTPWKVRHLAHCRAVSARDCVPSAHAVEALGAGLYLGRHCIASCAGAAAIVVATGAMDLAVMAVVTSAITLERWVPNGARTVQCLGALAIAAGGWLIASGM